MSPIFNIYCDESCPLESDRHKAMVLGAIWSNLEQVRKIAFDLREIKQCHQLSPGFEIKWTKVSPAKVQLYLNLIDYFFDKIDLHFRAIFVADKSLQPGGNDLSYYEFRSHVYLNLLRGILNLKACYRIYLYFKDPRGGEKIEILENALSNSFLDFSREIVERIPSRAISGSRTHAANRSLGWYCLLCQSRFIR